jgi:hypothetical protein
MTNEDMQNLITYLEQELYHPDYQVEYLNSMNVVLKEEEVRWILEMAKAALPVSE